MSNIKEYLKKDEKSNLDVITEQMSGAEIAAELGITRQAISNTLKRAMKKLFLETKKMDKSWDNFDCAISLAQMLGVAQDSGEEIKKFFKLFPPDIRKQIEADGAKLMRK